MRLCLMILSKGFWNSKRATLFLFPIFHLCMILVTKRKYLSIAKKFSKFTAATLQAQECLDLADHFAAGGFRFEQLPDEAFEGQAQAEDAVAAVGAVLLGGGQR